MKTEEQWVLLGAGVGVITLGVLAVRAYLKSPTALLVPPPPPVGPVMEPLAAGSPGLITLVPGQASTSATLSPGDPVIIHLPIGSKWISADGAPLHPDASPYVFVFRGPIQHIFVWIDPSGAQNETLVIFYLAPSPSQNI
jgi:hypothetical protein